MIIQEGYSLNNFNYQNATRQENCDDKSCESPINAQEKLSDEEKQEVTELKARDREVRSHEAAHASAGGQYAGSPSFEYANGPDGRRYAVGGEVPIDASPVSGDPQATIKKMQIVRKAALAPANPSGQDRAVASKASQLEAKARQELTEEKTNPDKSEKVQEVKIDKVYNKSGKIGSNNISSFFPEHINIIA